MHCHQGRKFAFGGENVSVFMHLLHPEGYSVQGVNLSLHTHFQGKYACV
jgi:tRNA U34 2-thiouridine synthase MnmA/TrmU